MSSPPKQCPRKSQYLSIRRMKIYFLFYILLIVFSIYCIVLVAWYHLHILTITHGRSEPGEIIHKTEPTAAITSHQSHALLSCDKYGGPYESKIAQNMVYWKDIPSDAKFSSPYKRNDRVQYLTFEPDLAAWNNRR